MAVAKSTPQAEKMLRSRRRGRIRRLAGVAVLAVAAFGAWRFRHLAWSAEETEIILEQVKVGMFVHDVIDRGEVESSSNVNVVCEVQSQNAEGVRIIQIVPEGTVVEAGDFLVKLDDAALRTDLAKQRIDLNTAAAALSEAQNELASLTIAREEYEFGTFKQDEAKLESELLVAEENLRRSESTLKHTEKMASRGYASQLTLEADRFAVAKYRKELEVAEIKLDVLRRFTKAKTLKDHESKIKTAEAKVAAETAKHEIELEKLHRLEDQLAKTNITAPIAGQVVYAELERWRNNGESAIRAGTRVREQQIIIRLPDSRKMQVKAKISEARVNRVKPGMKVDIRLDALPGLKLRGEVKHVSPYASNENWLLANVKEYSTLVEILDPPETLRPGMSAQVAIRVETIPRALQVPVQAVVERGGKFYCLLRDKESKLAAREVLVGATNEKFLVVREGLTEGQEVVMNPREHLEEVGLPATDLEPAKIAAGETPPADERPQASASTSTAPAASEAKASSAAEAGI